MRLPTLAEMAAAFVFSNQHHGECDDDYTEEAGPGIAAD
jgi:hypothetical protein